jgi:RimJ/RimL family protein N-acetyltransferase
MLAPITLEGSFVRLVPLAHEHVDSLCALGVDPQLWQSTTVKLSSREQMGAYLRNALEAMGKGTELPFAIFERAGGKITGMTRLHSAVPEHKRVEIGMTWIAPAWQRTAVNSESKYLLLRHLFETLGCVRAHFTANSANERSRQALLRLGAKEEGILRCYRVAPSGQTFDLFVFSIIASEWPDVRSRLETRLYRRSS